MVSLTEFLEIFRDTGFSQQALNRFYRSIRKSIIFLYVGRIGFPLLLKLVMRDQWPILEKIDDPNLSIYKEADPELLAAFIKTIKRQKEKNTWVTLRDVIYERAELFKIIFGFSPQEIAICEQEGKRFEKILEKKNRKRRLMFGIGGGIIAAGAAGTGAFLWWKAKEKK